MKYNVKSLFKIFKTAAKEWWSKDPFKESAVIAYYAIFSLPGLLVLILTVAGYLYGQDDINNKLSDQIASTMGQDTAVQVSEMIEKARATGSSVWATIIGIVTIIVGATGVFAQFQKSLNIIWEVKADESKSGILSLIKVRLFSFGLIISVAFILVISLVVSTLLAAFGGWLQSNFSETLLVIVQILNVIISLSILALIFSLMFKFFPDAKIKWRHVWVGSFVTAILFELGKFGLSLYFGKASPESGYGAAGSIILILLWVSYSSMIVFLGAEFTRAFANYYDGDIPADKNAVKDNGRQK
ncbi:MAG: YihY/virulence factor BrkB family protein [Bacteroidetes bacterium]|nr:YihY/virulence factor BrkB family protein [Bacteroidota bacterium]MBK8362977.1 YihY/virulence factor BrkB family protein [Bacteroidota bacterium]MBK9413672.1 YihY/virulence factor BrkB family protein [Bacteroidota bacterium]MBP6427547.1 YihY/virulence factor BrkB family protein [Bacteroidia bacterium]MBP6658918.1 YihY/virulence factor BrkB family protein [Bacteroidia bacterium]